MASYKYVNVDAGGLITMANNVKSGLDTHASELGKLAEKASDDVWMGKSKNAFVELLLKFTTASGNIKSRLDKLVNTLNDISKVQGYYEQIHSYEGFKNNITEELAQSWGMSLEEAQAPYVQMINGADRLATNLEAKIEKEGSQI